MRLRSIPGSSASGQQDLSAVALPAEFYEMRGLAGAKRSPSHPGALVTSMPYHSSTSVKSIR